MRRSVPARRTLAALAAPLLLAAAGCGSGIADAPAAPPEDTIQDANPELVLDLRDGTSLDALKAFAARHGNLDVRFLSENEPGIRGAAIAVARVPLERQLRLLEELRKDELVEQAEHNATMSFPEINTLDKDEPDLIPDDGSHEPAKGFPNDPLYAKQWHLNAVRARDAWRWATGKGVIVAVIDTGVAYETKRGILAPDLAKTEFVPGWDFVNDNAVAADDHGHGTHCAGTIAQSTNNGRGVAGVAPGARIMPIKVLSASGSGTLDGVIAGIRYAADHGAKVLSLSLGGGGPSRALDSAVAYARRKGCAVVCAAGNARRNRVEYPAACPGAFAVSSTGPDGSLAFYSSYGKELLCAGPGGDKRSGAAGGVLQNTLDPRDKKKTVFAWWQGTSMATPHVAATCALLAEAGVTDPEAMRKIIIATSRKPEGSTPGWDEKLGFGTIDALAAVRRARTVPAVTALAFAGLLLAAALRLTKAKDLGRGLLAGGLVAGSSGLFFLPLVGLDLPGLDLLSRAVPTWDAVTLGGTHWSPVLASGLVPFVAGLIATRSRFARSITVGLALGWASHLAAQAVLGWACVAWIPESLERPWLALNAIGLVLAAAAFVRLGRSKGDGV